MVRCAHSALPPPSSSWTFLWPMLGPQGPSFVLVIPPRLSESWGKLEIPEYQKPGRQGPTSLTLQAPCPQHSPGREKGSPFAPPPPLLNLGARLPDISCPLWPVDPDSVPVWGTSLCLQASMSQVQEPRQAGGSRPQQGTEFHSQPPKSAAQELGLQPTVAFLILPATSHTFV